MNEGAEYVTKAEYLEHKKTLIAEQNTLIAENNRQNVRLERLEVMADEVKNLALSANTLATNMQHILEEIQNHALRLGKLESKDGDMWRSIIQCIVTGIATLLLGFVFGKFFK